jgi:arylsulfatase
MRQKCRCPLPAIVIGFLAIAVQAAPRPNIVLIMADDMGFSDVGCFGGEIRTPNLDKMAADGLRFTQFYNAGRCCPTRASLLTGLYSHQAGIGYMTGNQGVPSYQGYLNDRCVTIAEVLRTGGYATLMTGKWHVGSARQHWPTKRGFDRFYGVPEGGGCYFKLKKGRSLVLDEAQVEPEDDWYTTDAFTDYAIKFVEQATDSERPFFLYVAYNAPHWPLQARQRDIARYRGKYMVGWDKIRMDRYARMLELGVISPNWPLPARDGESIPWSDEDQKEMMDLRMAVYAAQVDSMDQNIGRILQTLERTGVKDNTLVMFLMDNGGCAEGGRRGFTKNKSAETGTAESYDSYGLSWAHASNTPFRRYKSWVHEGGIATPLIACWPQGIKRRGELEHQPSHVIDLMATCIDLAGVEYPPIWQGKPINPLEGRSLVPTFDGQSIEREALYWEHMGNRAVRIGKWKLVAVNKDDWELYDLDADRPETNNLAHQHHNRVKQMAAAYDTWADRVGVMPWPVKRLPERR